MLVSNADLIGWVESAGARANARDLQHIRLVMNTLTITGLVADSDSESSKRVQGISSNHKKLLTDTARERLESVVLFGVDIPVCDAFPYLSDEIPKIVLFDGLLYLIRFYTDLQILMALLIEQADEITVEIDGERIPVALAMSLAGHTALVDSIDTNNQLMDISALLGPRAKQQAMYGYSAAVLFFVLHELGHLSLGHLEKGYVSERVAVEMRVPEAIGTDQQMELDADAFAVQCIVPQVRSPFISSIMFALGPFAFLETFKGNAEESHPLTVNRIGALANEVHFPGDPESAKAASSIVDAHVERFERLASQREANDGDIRFKIQENMSLRRAYQAMNQVGDIIKERVGTLDLP